MNTTLNALIKTLFFTVLLLAFMPARSQGVDEQYKEAIASADAYFDRQDYLNAKASYQVASQLKPEEQYPKQRLQESIRLLKVQMEKMAGYNSKLAYADKLFREGSWETAIAAYEEAQKIMPSREYPAEQIAAIREIQEGEAENEAAFSRLMDEGDELFSAGDYKGAEEKYLDASAIYPGRTAVKEKLASARGKIDELAALKNEYEKAIGDAEMYHARRDYENELLSYQKAAEIRPEETLPREKIRELNEFLRSYEAYNKYVSEGDELYISQQYAEARSKYEKALEILPDENYPKEIINKIGIALSEKAERDRAAYEEAIAKADELYSQEDYDAAMVAYSDALRFWPEGEHARERIGSISEIMALKKAQEEAYNNAITLADKLFADKDYEASRAEYRKAADINPFEQYPKVRIGEIDMILAEIRDLTEQYNSVIQGADKLFNVGDYAQARIQYLRAQEILSDRNYPAGQISMIDEILGKEKATREAYDAAIARGDEHFGLREWEDAKVDYVEANDLIPEEQYPKDRISEINNIMAQLKAREEAYTLALKTADELFAGQDFRAALVEYRKAAEILDEKQYPKQKIEEINGILEEEARLAGIEESYSNAVAEGDRLFGSEEYEEARVSYSEASAIKPEEAYPGEKIAEIDAILAEQARLKALEEDYAKAILAGDKAMEAENYEQARAEYEQALKLKPGEQYPQDRISGIDAIFEAEAARLAQLGADYAKAISSADAMMEAEDYMGARASYSEALELKPGEQYPMRKIEEIDVVLAEQERLRVLEEAYASAVSKADSLLGKEIYSLARASYADASGLKPGEAYPREKIAEIDAIMAEQARLQKLEEDYMSAITQADQLYNTEKYAAARSAYQLALDAMPDDTYAAGRITELDGLIAEQTRLQELEDNYNNAINIADQAFSEENYQAAMDSYRIALTYKEEEQYPQDRINEINSILDEQARLEAIRAAYDALIASADSLFAAKDYEQSLDTYNEALEVKDTEVYPQQKIDEINAILEEIARQQALDESYASSLEKADGLFDRGAYAEALEEYNNALGLKPEETYPKERVTEINARLAEMEKERNQAYDAAIAKADSYYDMGNYRNARSAYETAVSIKPGEAYARERLDEVTILYMAELESLKVEYRKYIADADNYFNEKIYDGAIENYRIAAGILPDEPYPGQMIRRITKIINDNAITDVNKLAQVIPNNTDRKFNFNALPVNVRKENYILIQARNVSEHDFKMLVNFGQDNLKHGGVVLQVPEGEKTRDYIIRIGALYKWFSEDNNWLSIYPEGGDIEVALIRISKSD